jgi:peptidase E
MKLLLTSYRIPNPDKLADLLDKPIDQTVGLIVTNAKERRTPEERAIKLKALQDDLAQIGLINTAGIDLRTGTPALEDYDYVFAAGGNTFALRKAMIDTGFDEKLKEYLDNGGVYVGESAGAIAVGPSLRGFESIDNYFDGAPFEGAGIIDAIIVPHNDSADPAYNNRYPEIQAVNPDLTVIPLGDKEEYVINTDKH